MGVLSASERQASSRLWTVARLVKPSARVVWDHGAPTRLPAIGEDAEHTRGEGIQRLSTGGHSFPAGKSQVFLLSRASKARWTWI